MYLETQIPNKLNLNLERKKPMSEKMKNRIKNSVDKFYDVSFKNDHEISSQANARSGSPATTTTANPNEDRLLNRKGQPTSEVKG